ncbi:unnamed protein product [Heterobilharzia americana]|nr:unnamed protein product [Heterobilharzia americana]
MSSHGSHHHHHVASGPECKDKCSPDEHCPEECKTPADGKDHGCHGKPQHCDDGCHKPGVGKDHCKDGCH